VCVVCVAGTLYLLWEFFAAVWEFFVKRPVVIAVRVTEEEAAQIDRDRGSLTRSAWLRLLLVNEARSKKQGPPRGLSGVPGTGTKPGQYAE
jgi:hypothetical protein